MLGPIFNGYRGDQTGAAGACGRTREQSTVRVDAVALIRIKDKSQDIKAKIPLTGMILQRRKSGCKVWHWSHTSIILPLSILWCVFFQIPTRSMKPVPSQIKASRGRSDGDQTFARRFANLLEIHPQDSSASSASVLNTLI